MSLIVCRKETRAIYNLKSKVHFLEIIAKNDDQRLQRDDCHWGSMTGMILLASLKMFFKLKLIVCCIVCGDKFS